MPFVKVAPADLVIGKDYVLTHIGCASRMAGEQSYKRVPSRYASLAATGTTEVVPDCTILDNIQPSSKGLLEKAYKSWKAIQAETPTAYSGWPQKKNRNPDVIRDEKEYRLRAFYAGVNTLGHYVFTQERGFGSKGVAYKAVNAKEVENPRWARPGETFPKYKGYALGPGSLWIVWEEEGRTNNVPVGRTNNVAVERRNNAPKPNVPMGNLLGLNNKPKMANSKNNTLKARNNWLKQENRGQELKGLFGGSRTRRNNRY